jgi:hypothetical protein
MKAFLFCLGSVIVGQVALAQNTPVQKFGGCPIRTFASGGACVPVNDAQVFYNGGQTCPIGWTRSRDYCVR